MADYSIHTETPIRWRAKDLPVTIMHKDPECLSNMQKILTVQDVDAIRNQNARYLAEHPEIKAITNMLVTKIMSERPSLPLSKYCYELFSRPRDQILEDLKPYLPEDYEEAEIEEVDISLEHLAKLAPEKRLSQPVKTSKRKRSVRKSLTARTSFATPSQKTFAEASDTVVHIDSAAIHASGESLEFTKSIEDLLRANELRRKIPPLTVKNRRDSKAASIRSSIGERLTSILSQTYSGFSFSEASLKLDSLQYGKSVATLNEAFTSESKKTTSQEDSDQPETSWEVLAEKYLRETKYLTENDSVET